MSAIAKRGHSAEQALAECHVEGHFGFVTLRAAGADRGGAHRGAHELASALKERLVEVREVTVATAASPRLSSGIVAFDVAGVTSEQVVRRLRERGVVASVAPYPSALVRLTPSIRNSSDEVEAAAVRSVVA